MSLCSSLLQLNCPDRTTSKNLVLLLLCPMGGKKTLKVLSLCSSSFYLMFLIVKILQILTRLLGSEQKPPMGLNITSSASIQRAPHCGINMNYMHLVEYLELFEAEDHYPFKYLFKQKFPLDTITYLKYKVRSVDRMACFSSCIMLLYSLEHRLAKMLWPCWRLDIIQKSTRKWWQSRIWLCQLNNVKSDIWIIVWTTYLKNWRVYWIFIRFFNMI